ncbi:hypothetical protein CfE428DRAFT_1031 [Chthoniobacter flavus Ellin428]|uniref:DUF7305 domain-containing protein n=1 Tax=Chthoniobacter flavus Ellin428 TaxID=497964 RepID=B4CWJ3_9BACT|nr:hypothetical protein [Chthoniobacter flavus]EDY21785.1 hypothetical protein CfE428DRAFT_1031 [Chthoniobacter flavus Ellin428]TCO95715.1 hypothetical protein EV701_101406 [Chthoniobacter flavus]
MKFQSSLSQPTARREDGSSLLAALCTLVVLALIAGSTFLTVSSRFRSNYQTASWHDALTSAEDGAQYALVRLRAPLTKVDPSLQQGGTSSTSWTALLFNQTLTNPLQVPGSLQSDLATLTAANASSTNGTVTMYTSGGNTYPRIQLPTLSIPHGGQNSTGSTVFSANVTVDALPGTGGANSSGTWYRIRSTGIVPLAGGAKVGSQKYDNLLRKLQFHVDSAGNTLTTPQASRTIEVIAKPVFIGDAALFSATGINLNNHNITIDSYNSTDPNASTGGIPQPDGSVLYGQYSATKATQQANVVSDDNPLGNGTPGVINLSPSGANIFGNVATNDTPVQGSTANVHGTVTTDFYEALPNPPDPNTMTGVIWTPLVPSKSDITLDSTNGTAASPIRYEVSDTKSGDALGLQSSNLIITGTGYIEIWIPGGLSISGNAGINIPAGAHVTFYVDKSVSIAGNGIVNTSTVPSNLTFYGDPNPKSTQQIDISGNGVFSGVVYAPNSSVSVKGGGSNGEFDGAIIGNTISFTGDTKLHYDTALGNQGAVLNYSIASWFEDNTLVPR